MRESRNFIGLLGMAAVVLLTGCNSQDYGRDFCEAEGRHIPDREKVLRFLMHRNKLGYSWQNITRSSPHFGQWMKREVSDNNDTRVSRYAIKKYLTMYPNFIQLIGREPFVHPSLSHSKQLIKDAIRKGYYADIVIMGGKGHEYPKFKERNGFRELKYKNGYFSIRYGITNCGKFINWMEVGG